MQKLAESCNPEVKVTTPCVHLHAPLEQVEPDAQPQSPQHEVCVSEPLHEPSPQYGATTHLPAVQFDPDGQPQSTQQVD